ncbi:phospholipase A2 [Drechmeria coniospora]|uniref:Putative phospholipase n=1 Tax=Drechmeria coniospora TaxID=98403 RepID=A0A151GX52_DRECN|nr:phospholipase A2 [Drechmeria coniospora]KYK61678.1 phospholipase A2 [Drechmeria coniospora]
MTPKPTAASKIAACLARMSLVPAFPEYTGPYKVGTVDVETPVSELNAPSDVPEEAVDIPTVQFRVFYPAVPESGEKRISWLPNPQRHHVSAYTKFLGVGSALAEVLSFLPRHLHYTSIPVCKNAKMAEAKTGNGRWPTMIFSHGLGGGRNSYSYIAGSLASHGVVVICPEHRDGSAVTAFVRQANKDRRIIPYSKISHKAGPEVYEAREGQLRTRLWELGLIHDAVLAIDQGQAVSNLNLSTPSLQQFSAQLDVQDPGRVVFGGHSFGAATMVQFLKSTYYADTAEVVAMRKPLFSPAKGSSLRRQITERTVTMLLDMWCLPLAAPNSAPLLRLPLPMFADLPSASGGRALLAVESEAFFKWTEHLHLTARILSPDPSATVVTSEMFERPGGVKHAEPNFFYVVHSAHLSQSDFGILFPWLTSKVFGAENPERVLRLNLRAQLQLFRVNGFPVAPTHADDLVDGAGVDVNEAELRLAETVDEVATPAEGVNDEGVNDDKAIFHRSGNGGVECWKFIDLVGLGEAGESDKDKPASEQVAGIEKMKSDNDPLQDTPSHLVRTRSAAAA